MRPVQTHTLELVGHQGNAYAIIGRVRRALREAGVSDEEVKQLSDEATSGDYDPAADRSSMTRNLRVGAGRSSEGSALLITGESDVQPGYVGPALMRRRDRCMAVGCSVPNPIAVRIVGEHQ